MRAAKKLPINHLPSPDSIAASGHYGKLLLPPAGAYVALCSGWEKRRWNPAALVTCAICIESVKNRSVQFRNLLHRLGVRFDNRRAPNAFTPDRRSLHLFEGREDEE